MCNCASLCPFFGRGGMGWGCCADAAGRRRKVVVVFFIGGVTYLELAALRFMTDKCTCSAVPHSPLHTHTHTYTLAPALSREL